MMKQNIAIVGCGYWGKNLVRNFAELGVLHTVCDVNNNRLEDLQSLYPRTRAETEYSKVLKVQEIKGVVIGEYSVACV